MTNETMTQVTKQAETLFSGFSNYASLALGHFEKLANAQFEASKAYTEASLKQARAALEIRDQEGFKNYVESQQQFAKEVGERVKGDTKKFTDLNQEFARDAQKLVEGNVKAASKKAA